MTEDLAKFESRAVTTPAIIVETPGQMIQLALTQGADLEKLEKVLDLQERWEKNQARKAYVAAMAAFQANPPEIFKNKKVGYTTKDGDHVGYAHATLANVTSQINKGLSPHGLFAYWTPSQSDKTITVTCTIIHQMGHSESTSLSAAPDTSGKKNSIQAIGSSVSYLERYTILALTGLATVDQDDDGNSAGKPPEYITEKQLSSIVDMINDLALNAPDKKKFLVYMGVESNKKILANDFNKAKQALIDKKAAQEKTATGKVKK